MAMLVSSAVYVFVAATAFSDPASTSRYKSAACARGESVSLVMARVRQPWRLPSASTLTMSGDWPDWEIPTTNAFFKRGGWLYIENREGAASARGSWLKAPHR